MLYATASIVCTVYAALVIFVGELQGLKKTLSLYTANNVYFFHTEQINTSEVQYFLPTIAHNKSHHCIMHISFQEFYHGFFHLSFWRHKTISVIDYTVNGNVMHPVFKALHLLPYSNHTDCLFLVHSF